MYGNSSNSSTNSTSSTRSKSNTRMLMPQDLGWEFAATSQFLGIVIVVQTGSDHSIGFSFCQSNSPVICKRSTNSNAKNLGVGGFAQTSG